MRSADEPRVEAEDIGRPRSPVGMRARDWADFQEGTVRPFFQAVLERTGVAAGTRYLDAGCGSGMAAQMAAARGAEVSGVDVAEAMLSIARACRRATFTRAISSNCRSRTKSSMW